MNHVEFRQWWINNGRYATVFVPDDGSSAR